MNIEDITLAEMAEIEKIADAPISWLSEDDKPKGKLLHALNFVMKKRENPSITMEEAGKTPIAEVMKQLGEVGKA